MKRTRVEEEMFAGLEKARADKALVAERDELRRALTFYADRRNHSGVGVSAVYQDNGERARDLLGMCGECNGLGLSKTGEKIRDQDGVYDEYRTCASCWGAGIGQSDEAGRCSGSEATR